MITGEESQVDYLYECGGGIEEGTERKKKSKKRKKEVKERK